MTAQPYHRYVFDIDKKQFVGKFEEMYANEDKEGYDSWYQSDLTHLTKQLSHLILNRYNFDRILDVGCGGGAFTHLLKKTNNQVFGTDISKTAISKAKAKYCGINFICLPVEEALSLRDDWNLIIMMEILSYLENWRDAIKKTAEKTEYLFISLYLPPNPIGFVKSFEELKKEIKKSFTIETELLYNEETIYLLAKKIETPLSNNK